MSSADFRGSSPCEKKHILAVGATRRWHARGCRFIALVFVVMQISGCVKDHPLDRAAAMSVSRILLLPVGEPATLAAINSGDPGYMFGAVGAAVATAIEGQRSAHFSTLARNAGDGDLGALLADVLARDLRANGYEIVSGTTSSARPRPNAFYTDYATFNTTPGADAILDIVIDPAGYDGTLILPFRPFVTATVRLVTTANGQAIYEEQWNFNPDFPQTAKHSVGSPDPSCVFPTSAALNAAAPRAIECLRKGTELIAHTIAADLRQR
jgi:hypothetical protein